MLTQLDLKTFKCFELLKLPLGALTLLAGLNAAGKSSVLQSLVLLHQTMREHEWSTRLSLNGSMISLGTATDVIDQVSGRGSFEFGLFDDQTNCNWTFAGDRKDMSLDVGRIEVGGEAYQDIEALRYLVPADADEAVQSLALRIRDLTYISAERAGPREVYPLEDQHGIPTVGPAGENVVSVLYRNRDERVVDELLVPGAVPTLLHQVEARLGRFFQGCRLEVGEISNLNSAILRVKVSPETEFLRPVHCGFGITQALPIIVAALSAPKGSILLIENPEVHLHPAGQALMGRLLAEVAHTGIQVIVETHSDHVLNGVRRSVRMESVAAEEVAVHFFMRRSEDSSQVLSPIVDSSGNIDVWPDGFFDQFDKDMNYFAGWGE